MATIRNPFTIINTNKTTQQTTPNVTIPGKTLNLKLNSQPFKSKSRMTYSISDLLSCRKNAVPYLLPIDVQNALAERNTVPYKTPMKKHNIEKEDDPHRIENREKQISYGKSSEGYINYVKYVPVSKRVRGDPKTPDVEQVCSKRSWDGQVKKWRRALHAFDECTCEDDLKKIRESLVIINATPNKQKIKTPMTEPVKRSRNSKLAMAGRTLVFDDADVD